MKGMEMPDATQSDNLKVWSNDPAAPMVLRAAKEPIPTNKISLAIDDFVECDFPGYSAVTLNDFEVTDEQNPDLGNCLTDAKKFVASDALVDPQPIHVMYVTRHRVGQTPDVVTMIVLSPPILVAAPGQEVLSQVRTQGIGL